MRLKDKVILVTGATSGIGAAMASAFEREGAKVMIHELARSESSSDRHAYGDLRNPELPKKLIELTVSRFGRIDCLVNNAAMVDRADLESTSVELFDDIIAVNVRAPLLMIQAALPHFLAQGEGRVLNIGSVNAYCGGKHLLPYSISKGALMTMTRNLCESYGAEGIRVNQINVGWTHTEREDILNAEAGRPPDWAQNLPSIYVRGGRLLDPKEVAQAAVFFFSEEAKLINGAVLDFEQHTMIGRNPPKTL